MNPVSLKRQLRSGQALIEFALVLPLLFLLILNVVNFGAFMYAWITISNAARAGAQYMIMGGATVASGSLPTPSEVQTLVQQDIALLPNHATATVRVCNGFDTCVGTPTAYTTPTDPEGGFYRTGSVDVTYTYTPLVNAFSFPRLGVHLTLPRTTMHRKAIMRVLN